MTHRDYSFAAFLILPLLAGCSGKKDGAGSDGGWKVGAEQTQPVPARAKGYGQIHGNKGDEVRVTVTSTARPIDVRLYLDKSGKQTELGKKEQVTEATLEATLAGDGEVMLQMIGGKEGDTDVRYKMESRPGKR
jgi:hypothetical protein